MTTQTNNQLKLAFDFIQYTNQSVFLTGKAGTGKTTFLRNLKETSPKRMIIVAPTGVAAINAGGVTIHSFFQIPFGPQIPYFYSGNKQNVLQNDNNKSERIKRYSREKINIIKSIDLLIIDEISMVRADVLDAVDDVLRRFKDRTKPFGGTQLLMIGDLQQLSPIIKEEEWNLLRDFYESCYFFSSRALKQSNFVGIELTEVFRQKDQTFINILNKIRDNDIDSDVLHSLNKRYIPDFNYSDEEGYITLTTHNYQAKQINDKKLNEIKGKLFRFNAEVEGDFPEYIFPSEFTFLVKKGSQVMFIKNDSSIEKRYYNGKIGVVSDISDDYIDVYCREDKEEIRVSKAQWENYRYSIDEPTNEIKEEVIGRFNHFPLKLAWAITIHKSQGLTFDKAIIDARLSFTHGQVYVALSRCRTLEGIVLSSPIEQGSVISDKTVLNFTNTIEKNQPGYEQLEKFKADYQKNLLTDLFDFRYLNNLVHNVLKLWGDDASELQGNLAENLRSILDSFKNEVVRVGDNFKFQIVSMLDENSDLETNRQLQERLSKGSSYFSEKLTLTIESALKKSVFYTSISVVKRNLNDLIEKIYRELFIKKGCLSSVAKGFELQSYLMDKSKAAIEKIDTSHIKISSKQSLSLQNPEIFDKLINWRECKSKILKQPLAKIIAKNILIEISNIMPVTLSELKSVKGFTDSKIKQFGKEILDITNSYSEDDYFDEP